MHATTHNPFHSLFQFFPKTKYFSPSILDKDGFHQTSHVIYDQNSSICVKSFFIDLSF